MPSTAPRTGLVPPLGASVTIGVVALAQGLWARYLAGEAGFLFLGVGLAILFSGAFTLWGLLKTGGMELPESGARTVVLLLVASTLLLAVHFSTLVLRRSALAAGMEAGRRAVESIESYRSSSGLPPDLETAGVSSDDAARLTYQRVSEENYLVCFASPGRRSSCYDSSENEWRVYR